MNWFYNLNVSNEADREFGKRILLASQTARVRFYNKSSGYLQFVFIIGFSCMRVIWRSTMSK